MTSNGFHRQWQESAVTVIEIPISDCRVYFTMQDDSEERISNVVKSKSLHPGEDGDVDDNDSPLLDSRLGFGMVGHRLALILRAASRAHWTFRSTQLEQV